MRHIHKESKENKIRKWLELCDISFELFRGGVINKYGNEESVLDEWNKKMKRNVALKRKAFSKIPAKILCQCANTDDNENPSKVYFTKRKE